jgi:putative ABC transport system permease protein
MRWYRALLHLYPASFRDEYGDELSAVFARTHGGASAPGRALAAIVDILPNAIAAHWEIFRQDLRYCARGLRRAPGFALTAVLVVALGVGANTAAFSLADFVLIRPLPFPRSDRLVRVNGDNDISPGVYRDWKRMTKSFEAMGAFNFLSANFVAQPEPQRVDGARVTADLLGVLGVRPMIGRTFTDSDDRPGTTPTIVIAYGLWQTYFGGDPGVVGRAVNLDGTPHVILGVMPATFNFPNRQTRFWKPFQFAATDYEDRDNSWIFAVGRLHDGVALAQARSDLQLVTSQLEQQDPRERDRAGAPPYLLRDGVSRQARLLLQTLCGAALCILLLACANLANLLLARAVGREREMSVRAALGAGRERLVRQLVTESALLAVLGGVVGVLVAMASVPPLARLAPNTLPLASEPTVDLRVLVFAAVLTAITGVVFGVIPAMRVGRVSPVEGLREGARAGGRRQRARFVLVTVEVMASVVLLISSGLLVRAMLRVQATSPGFRTDGVLTLRTQLPLPQYEAVAHRSAFYRRVLTGVRALPGVSSAAYSTGLPMAMRGGIWDVSIAGRPVVRDGSQSASARFVTPQFFKTLGIPLRQGRDVEESDGIDRPFVAVVSEDMVTRYWPGENPIGKRFTFGPAGERSVVGVVGNVRVRGLERSSEPQVYLAYQQVDDGSIIGYIPKDLAIQSSAPARTLLPAVRRIIREADPEQPISGVRTIAEIVADETASRLAQLRVLGVLAAIALLLAGVGIHGLLSFMVSQRSQEIGVRLALGARPAGIVRMILREGVFLATAGVVPGVAIAYAAGRAMQSLLFGVRPADPATLLAAVVLCSAMAVVGSLLPALRATRVDPARVMRAE